VEDTLAVLAGVLGEMVVGRLAKGSFRESSVKESIAGIERGIVRVACSVCAGSAAVDVFQVLQGGGRSPWI
jgi:hypothetical protein